MLLNFKYLIFTCLKVDVSIFKNEISQLLSNSTKFPANWEVNQTKLNFKEIYYPSPPNGGAHFMNFIIWEPLNKPGTTVFYVNYRDGWNSLIENYSKKFKRISVQVGMSDEDIIYPMYKFSYYNGLTQRIILSYKDDKKWEFIQKGEMIAFEEDKYYHKRNIKDRLPNSLIIKYLQEIDWNIVDENFWKTNQPVYNFRRISWDN